MHRKPLFSLPATSNTDPRPPLHHTAPHPKYRMCLVALFALSSVCRGVSFMKKKKKKNSNVYNFYYSFACSWRCYIFIYATTCDGWENDGCDGRGAVPQGGGGAGLTGGPARLGKARRGNAVVGKRVRKDHSASERNSLVSKCIFKLSNISQASLSLHPTVNFGFSGMAAIVYLKCTPTYFKKILNLKCKYSTVFEWKMIILFCQYDKS